MAAQAAVLVESFGLDPSLFIRAVTGTNTDSPYLHYRAAQLTGTSDEVLSPVRAAIKDLGHIRSAASSAAVPELLLATLQQIYDGAADAGLATGFVHPPTTGTRKRRGQVEATSPRGPRHSTGTAMRKGPSPPRWSVLPRPCDERHELLPQPKGGANRPDVGQPGAGIHLR